MSYLDINKSVIISSPAGSGKTEKLARRYIALLKSGVDVERILAITFTDKAAAEMKQRILRILKEEDEALFQRLLEKMPIMRVSTIHSFCGTLIRRFSFEASIDPNYRIEEAIDSRILWDEILYEIFMEAGAGGGGQEILLQSIGEKGFRGLAHLKTTVNNLFEKIPFSLEAEIAPYSPSGSHISLIEEIKEWPGAKEAIEDYEDLFKKDDFYGLVAAEKYFLTQNKVPRKRAPADIRRIIDYQDWASKMFLYWKDRSIQELTKRSERVREVFKKCFDRYGDKKALKGILDFSDLEYFAYRLLTGDPEWSNILYAFDERTDHILVDEFQDTNRFQWAVIDKLTEEWRSGVGAKRDEGIIPTIFLVGDEKQSIYFFRGADVEVFHGAKKKLDEWLKDEFYYEEVKENYRSRPAIIDFANFVFSKIMGAAGIDSRKKTASTFRDEKAPSWITTYSPFEAFRKDVADKGKVELILLDADKDTVAEARQREAAVIAKRIQNIVGNFQIIDKTSAQERLCRYVDIALLLRKRTHLRIYEGAFRQHGIPFVAVKGIGFYQEPEVAMLRALVYFLSNPRDDYSLYVLLKSPFFSLEESLIIKTMGFEGHGISSRPDGESLFSKVKKAAQSEKVDAARFRAVRYLEEWLLQLPHTPISELMEKALIQTNAWEFFYEAQKRANVKKFICLVENLEAQGKSLLKIRDFLERTEGKADEPKANVNTEGMDAVKIMTIHASKGLEFPVVFVPGLEEKFVSDAGNSLIYDSGGELFVKYMPESAVRKNDEDFLRHMQKEEEEQKRLFYVAVTRAEEALFLLGQWRDDSKGFLGFLKKGLGLKKADGGYKMSALDGEGIQGFELLSEQEVDALFRKAPKPELSEKQRAVVGATRSRAEVIPIKPDEAPAWKAVTEGVNIKRRHGRDWVIIGDVIHRLLEGVSKRRITEGGIVNGAERFLASRGVVKGQRDRLVSIIEKDFTLLKQKGIWQDVVTPREDSYSELPFILESENAVYAGRIDRVIKENGIYKVYDYKTFPADEKEMEYLLKEYSFQMGIYQRAIEELFGTKNVKSFIVFTHTGKIKKVI